MYDQWSSMMITPLWFLNIQDFEKAATIRDKQRKLKEKLDKYRFNWHNDSKKNVPTINEEDVADVVSMITGIPLSKVATSESEKLLNMTDELKKSIIGQDKAITKVSNAIQRARTGLKNPNHPIGSFMFLGPTILYMAFSNQEKSTFILILIIGLILSGLAIFFAFKGLKTIMDSMFKK